MRDPWPHFIYSYLDGAEVHGNPEKDGQTGLTKNKSGTARTGLNRFGDNLALRAVLAAADHWSPQWAYAEAVNFLCDDEAIVRFVIFCDGPQDKPRKVAVNQEIT